MATPTVPYSFVSGTLAKSSEVNANYDALRTFIGTNCVQRDGSVAFTAVPSGPSSDPVSANQFTRKSYVDGVFGYVSYQGDSQPGLGVETFTSMASQIARGVTTTATGFTILTTGWYWAHFYVGFASSASGTRRNAGIARNGTLFLADVKEPSGTTGGYGTTVAGELPIQLTAGDTISLRYTQDSGVLLHANAHMWIESLR